MNDWEYRRVVRTLEKLAQGVKICRLKEDKDNVIMWRVIGSDLKTNQNISYYLNKTPL